MSTTDVRDAAKILTNAHKELVLQENNLAALQSKVNDLMRQRDTLQKQIDEKVANANIVMSEQRGKLDSERSFIQSEREKLEAGKKELSLQIEAYRTEKAAFQKEKEDAKVMVDKAKYARTSVDQFIIAVKRAYDVLG